jgi:DNA (cytosine-5)-methyltransferase 1
MTTSKPTTQNHIQQTLFVVDSLAKTSAQQAKVSASPKKLGQVSFTNSSESFAWFDPDISSWKTWQRSLITDWELYSESWPRQGSIVNGHAFLQVHWAPVINEIDGGLLPTPLASTGDRRSKFKQGGTPLLGALLPTPTKQDFKRRGPNSKQQGLSNTENWAMLPTPCARDLKGPQTKGFKERGYGPLLPDAFTQTGKGTFLNPSFVEEMMGYPIGYTDLKH